jgi:hypothetical protein
MIDALVSGERNPDVLADLIAVLPYLYTSQRTADAVAFTSCH